MAAARKSKKDKSRRYKIAVCDWMILKRQKADAFKLAGEIGADGLEVDMGSLGDRQTFDNKLLDPVERKIFLEESKEYNIQICSLAMSGFYAQSFAERETVPVMVRDTINTMVMMQVNVAFLPLGVKGDLQGLTAEGLADPIALGSQRDLSERTDQAKPASLSQVGIDA